MLIPLDKRRILTRDLFAVADLLVVLGGCQQEVKDAAVHGKCVFSSRRKEKRDGTEVTFGRSAFHARASWIGKIFTHDVL